VQGKVVRGGMVFLIFSKSSMNQILRFKAIPQNPNQKPKRNQ